MSDRSFDDERRLRRAAVTRFGQAPDAETSGEPAEEAGRRPRHGRPGREDGRRPGRRGQRRQRRLDAHGAADPLGGLPGPARRWSAASSTTCPAPASRWSCRRARPGLVGEAADRAREDHRRRARRRSGCARRTPSSTTCSTARPPPTAYGGWWRTSTRRVVEARRQLTGRPARRDPDRATPTPRSRPGATPSGRAPAPPAAARCRGRRRVPRAPPLVAPPHAVSRLAAQVLLHRDPDAALGGRPRRASVAGVDVPDHAHARVVGQHPLDLLRGQRRCRRRR